MLSPHTTSNFSISLEQIEKLNAEINSLKSFFDELESQDFLFFSIDDVCKLTGWAKHTVESLFNHPAFPCTDLGKRKLVLKPAFIKFFMERRCRDDEKYWR